MTKSMRPYQAQVCATVEDELQAGISKQLVVMATGTGKTFTAVQIFERLKEKYNFKRALWITHTEELLEQSALAFLTEKEGIEFRNYVEGIGFLSYVSTNTGIFSTTFKMGAIKADVFVPEGEVVMASAQTLHRRLDKLNPDMFDLVVCDEAHLFGANTFVRSIQHFQPKLLLGLTATPYRTDGMLLGNIFDKIVYEYDIAKGIKDGFLCELDAVRVKTNVSLDRVRTVAGELNQKELSQEVNTPERNRLVVESYIKYASGRQAIMFCVDIEHAIALAAMFVEYDITCKAISGDEDQTPNRSQNIKDYKSGKIMVLTNCMVLTAGFDHPNTGCVGHVTPTKSLTKWLQCTGRGGRLKSKEFVDKFGQKCIILDFVDSTERHRLINAWNLDKELPPEERVFITQEKRDKLLEARAEKRSIKIEAKYNDDKRIDLLQLPTVKISDSYRMEEPATDKQLLWIASLGYDIQNISYTKKMCSEIISSQSASDKQIWALKRAGYDVSQGVTIAEAKKAFEDIDKRKQQAENKQQFNNSPFLDL